MNNNAVDKILLDQGVNFLPWVGKMYAQGVMASGRRLLILGESHYGDWGGVTHQLTREITRECVQETINREDGSPFWKYLEQALLNQERCNGWAPGGGASLWDTLAFYNFVQTAVSAGPRSRPSAQQFQESKKPFRSVLEQLRPDRVLVCGKSLWNHMEDAQDWLHSDIQAYRLSDGTQVWCLATVHPSSGRYSWKRLHPLILAFLGNPEDALTGVILQ